VEVTVVVIAICKPCDDVLRKVKFNFLVTFCQRHNTLTVIAGVTKWLVKLILTPRDHGRRMIRIQRWQMNKYGTSSTYVLNTLHVGCI